MTKTVFVNYSPSPTVSLEHFGKSGGNINLLLKTVLFIFCFLPPLFASGFDSEAKFEQISTNENLSQSVVSKIIQDKKGFLWVGTQNGLNRYDGYEFKIYTHSSINSKSISGNNISALFEDSSGNLWLSASRNGLDLFDREKNIFIHFKHDPNNPETISSNDIRHIFEDRKGQIWIATGGGLNLFDKNSKKAVRYVHDKNDHASIPSNNVLCVAEDSEGNIWVGTLDSGAARLDRKSGKFTSFKHDENAPNSISSNSVRAVLSDKNGDIWFGTDGGGLNKFDKSSGNFITWEKNRSNISSNFILSLYESDSGTIWIGTNGQGVDLFDPESGLFFNFHYETYRSDSLRNNYIRSIFQDKSGIMWLGTFGEGLNKYDSGKSMFRHYRHNPGDPLSLSNNYVWAIHESKDGNLWIGTYGGGLNMLDRSTGKFKSYTNNPKNRYSISGNIIYSILEDAEGNIWSGTRLGKLNRFDKKSGRFFHYPLPGRDEISVKGKAIIKIVEDSAGLIWVGTLKDGMYKFDPSLKTFTKYIKEQSDSSLIHNKINDIFIDSKQNFWTATDLGLSKFNRKEGVFRRLRTIEGKKIAEDLKNISVIKEKSENVLWIGTYGSGLISLNVKSGEFRRYTTADGMADDNIYSMQEDKNGNLWISTDRGLSFFNTIKETFLNYTENDGIQGNEFNQGAYHMSRDGELFFGGTNGFNAFFPDKVKINHSIPTLAITGFYIFNRPVLISETSPLKKSIDYTDEINLSHKDNVFSFEFSAMEFSSPERNRFAYKLEGFDEEWVYTNKRFATYTNLDDGSYIFRVKGSNNHGIWNENGASVRVNITPPPWKTWWAQLLYIIASFLLITGFIKYKTRGHLLKMAAQEKELERDRLLINEYKSIDKIKNQFLANTSHELRTPLNGIIGIADSLISGAAGELNKNVKNNLRMISSCGTRLFNLVNDILDFSKLKNQEISLSRKIINIKESINLVINLSKPLIGGKEIKIVNRTEEKSYVVYGDEARIRQIFHNLIENAIKFTKAGVIEIDARKNKNMIEFSVKDTGVGIAPENIKNIFGSFQQVDGTTAREFGGTGLGLAITRRLVELHGGKIYVKSIPDHGSTFTFSLPFFADDGPDVNLKKEIPEQISAIKSFVNTETVIDLTRDETGKTGGNLLIVDDEAVNIQVLNNYLTMSNFSVKSVFSGKDALKLLENGCEFDLVLLDIMMPEMSGYEVCTEIRKKYPPNELPIIFLTAKTMMANLVEGFEAGANDYITKPFSKEELIARIRSHISISKLNIAYSKFVPRELLASLDKTNIRDLRPGALAGSMKTILSSDISELQSPSGNHPEEAFTFFNKYFDEITAPVKKYRGFITRFTSDSLMALFPENPRHAVNAAIEMVRHFKTFNSMVEKTGQPGISPGFSIHFGNVTLGTIGGQKKMVVEAMSSAVSVSSKLKIFARLFKTEIIISDHALKKLKNEKEFNTRFLGIVKTGDSEDELSVYEIFDGDDPKVIELKEETKTLFEDGVNLFLLEKYKKALKIFEKIRAANSMDSAASHYIDMIGERRKTSVIEKIF